MDEDVERILQFIRLAEELLSKDSLAKIANVLLIDCGVHYEVNFSDVAGVSGYRCE